MRYLARSKFSRRLVHKKSISLIWQGVFKLGYALCWERKNTSSEFEWTLRKVSSDNNSRQICKQAIIKLLLAYSFWKMFFIGQNLNHLHMILFAGTFRLPLINSSRYWLFGVYFSPYDRNIASEYKLQRKPIIK